MKSDSALHQHIHDFVVQGIDEKPIHKRSDQFWLNLKKTGTEIWLDTGNIDDASSLWSKEMTALTTNNTLLNAEIQKGIYDTVISKAQILVKDRPLKQQVMEIAFIVNARHGLRLSKIFGGKVSVELHTDLAHDYNGIISYGTRLFNINPDQFLVKIPFTATGIIAARKLREMGVRINMTLTFSARQNVFATTIAQPAYVNVFLGRIGAYIRDNDLGMDVGIGEHTVFATQHLIREISGINPGGTKLIAASIRSAIQVSKLAGVDPMTIPAHVAADAHNKLEGSFRSNVDTNFTVMMNKNAEGFRIGKLWEVNEKELLLANEFNDNLPTTGDELINLAHKAGCGDIFPQLSEEEAKTIATDGKIPVHKHWAARMKSGDVAADSLLNLAGLASFAQDQMKLDKRIESIIE